VTTRVRIWPSRVAWSTLSGQRFATVMIDGAAADLTYLAGGASALDPAGGPSSLTIAAGTTYPLTEGAVPAGASYSASRIEAGAARRPRLWRLSPCPTLRTATTCREGQGQGQA
jgi:hypothetical protein